MRKEISIPKEVEKALVEKAPYLFEPLFKKLEEAKGTELVQEIEAQIASTYLSGILETGALTIKQICNLSLCESGHSYGFKQESAKGGRKGKRSLSTEKAKEMNRLKALRRKKTQEENKS